MIAIFDLNGSSRIYRGRRSTKDTIQIRESNTRTSTTVGEALGWKRKLRILKELRADRYGGPGG